MLMAAFVMPNTGMNTTDWVLKYTPNTATAVVEYAMSSAFIARFMTVPMACIMMDGTPT